MTPAERAVIEWAQTWRRTKYSLIADESEPWEMELAALVDALDAEKYEGPAMWATVAADDEIYSNRTQKWYRVVKVERQGPHVHVRVDGVPTPFVQDPALFVKCRRGATGAAVQTFVEVFSSE